jgi:hypothetical protein
MKLAIENLKEPLLQFGRGQLSADPKRGLTSGGAIGCENRGRIQIDLGLVGPKSEIEKAAYWLSRLSQLLLDDESNIQRFHEFPGSGQVFNVDFCIPANFVRAIDEIALASALRDRTQQGFERLLALYGDHIRSEFGDNRPGCVIVCFPEEVATLRVTNPRLTAREQRMLEAAQEDEDSRQGELFEPTFEERKAAAKLLPRADDLLFRNFHRALKAKMMNEHNAVPIQVLRRHTYVPEEAVQSNATRAWNLAIALYYKSGHFPWKPSTLDPRTCYVGISFHHLKRRAGDIVYASVAQAFSTAVQPFALKGESISHDQSRNKKPYLTAEQSERLISTVLREYKNRTDSLPDKLVIHKTSLYQPEEVEGFNSSLTQVPSCELVWLSPTGFRLLKKGTQEPNRGTLCTIQDRQHFLFTTGFVDWWREYPGPHIPAPLEMGGVGNFDAKARAEEILALTKMNWNSADGIGRYPITLTFSKRVGMLMTEMEDSENPNPLYRFYM